MPSQQPALCVMSSQALQRLGQHRVDSVTEQLACAVATRSDTQQRDDGVRLISAACNSRSAVIALWPDGTTDSSAGTVESLLRAEPVAFGHSKDLDATPDLIAVSDRGLLWWSSTNDCNDLLALVTAAGDVHILATGEPGSVHSEVLDDGDRIVAMTVEMASSLSNPELLLEMALVDDPAPSCALEWMIEAARGDNARGELHAAVWRHSSEANSVRLES